ncbi:hypothetical protein HK098_008395, partial [Nowakowskiella sp. JEL0407]
SAGTIRVLTGVQRGSIQQVGLVVPRLGQSRKRLPWWRTADGNLGFAKNGVICVVELRELL